MDIFVPAIWVSAGICLFAGIHFGITGLLRRQERVYLAFGLLCLLLAGDMMSLVGEYHANSVPAAAHLARIDVAFICLAYPAAVWFLGLYTNLKTVWPWVLAASLIFGSLFIINVNSPYSILYSQLTWNDPLILPWGEVLNDFTGTNSSLAFLVYASVYAVFLWAIWRCYALWRARMWRKASLLTIYLFIQLATIIYGEIVVQLGLRTVTLGEFAFLALVLLMSFSLRHELHQRTLALEASLARLTAETEKRRKVKKQLRHMAYHDYLTDLPNRRLLREILDGALAHSRESGFYGALLFLDLDHFKTINDSLGHHIGDQLLKHIASRLRETLPDSRCVARLGGDEFAILMGNVSRDRKEAETRALHAAETLTTNITKPVAIGNHELMVGASTGITLFPGTASDETEVMRQADMALYSAKSAGRNAVAAYAERMEHGASRRLMLEKGLRVALEKNELELHFQPQIDRAGQVIGAEALLRWQHPEHGCIEPRRFIPIAEETGLIHALGDYVLRSACVRIKTLQDSVFPIPRRLSINISPWQLFTPDFTQRVMSAVVTTGIDPDHLTLEITENAFLRDMDDVAMKIRALGEHGIRFSIDDFGSGYSALACLKKLPLQELKIDRVFINEMVLTPNDRFIETIISIAHHMDLYVIAEGVETEPQRQALAAMGCHAFQGYLFSKPLTEAAFPTWLRQHQTTSRNPQE